MGILLKLSALAARPLVRTACQALGLEVAQAAGEAVASYLGQRFTDHSKRLSEALRRANERAWQTLEFSLAGESLVNALARSEDQSFRAEVRSFLATVRLEHPPGEGPDFR